MKLKLWYILPFFTAPMHSMSEDIDPFCSDMQNTIKWPPLKIDTLNTPDFNTINDASKTHYAALMEFRYVVYALLSNNHNNLLNPTALTSCDNANPQTAQGLCFYIEDDKGKLCVATPWGEVPCLTGPFVPNWKKWEAKQLITELQKQMDLKKIGQNYYQICSMYYYTLPTPVTKRPHQIINPKNNRTILTQLNNWYIAHKAQECNPNDFIV